MSTTLTPLRSLQGQPIERRRSVHKVIHRLWKENTRRRSVVYRRGRLVAGAHHVQSVGSRRSVGVLASLSCADPAWNRHCQKLTVFSPSANSSATLKGSEIRSGSIVPDERDGCDWCDASDGVFWHLGRQVKAGGAGLTQRILVSTLEQSPARGDTAATGPGRGPRRLLCETDRA